MKLLFSHRFRQELRGEYHFLCELNPEAAIVVRQRIIKSILRLKRFPESGRAWRLAGCRELVLPGLPYIIIYQIDDDTVTIASLFYPSREVRHEH